ncbi:MAG: alpha-ribazole phosphatase family protein [Rikenellaceae bacterium]
MATIYLQRHTRPDVEEGTCYGISDVGLHCDFESAELPKVLQRLSGKSFTHVYSSPLQRCKTLADNISDNTYVDDRLMELNFGDWEMMSWNDIDKTDEGREWFADYLNCRTPNGESFQDLIARANSFLESIESLEDNILVVTHSGFIRAAMVAIGAIEQTDAFNSDIDYGDTFKVEADKISKL